MASIRRNNYYSLWRQINFNVMKIEIDNLNGNNDWVIILIPTIGIEKDPYETAIHFLWINFDLKIVFKK